MEGERLAIVERDNRILLEKMAFIMRTGGSVDNRKGDYMQKRYTFEIIFFIFTCIVRTCMSVFIANLFSLFQPE